MKRTFVLAHDLARRNAVQAVQNAPEGHVVTVGEASKRRIQEERYHAMIGDVARHCDHYGRKLDKEGWKRILIAAFVVVARANAKAEGKDDPFPEHGHMVPMLDGSGFIQLGVPSSGFTVQQASDFIEYLFGFGEELGVVWRDSIPERATA